MEQTNVLPITKEQLDNFFEGLKKEQKEAHAKIVKQNEALIENTRAVSKRLHDHADSFKYVVDTVCALAEELNETLPTIESIAIAVSTIIKKLEIEFTEEEMTLIQAPYVREGMT